MAQFVSDLPCNKSQQFLNLVGCALTVLLSRVWPFDIRVACVSLGVSCVNLRVARFCLRVSRVCLAEPFGRLFLASRTLAEEAPALQFISSFADSGVEGDIRNGEFLADTTSIPIVRILTVLQMTLNFGTGSSLWCSA